MADSVRWSFFASDKFSRPYKKIIGVVKSGHKEFTRANAGLKKMAKGMKSVASAAKGMSVAAIGIGVASLKAFGDMEQGVTNVLTLMDDEQVAKFGGAIDTLAKESLSKFGFSIEETTVAMFNNISALGTNEQSLRAFETAQRLAIGGVTSLDTAVSGIAAVMNAYGKEMTDANDVANAFFAAQKQGTTDVGKLASSVGQVAPIAKTAGIGFKELLATMAQLTQGGLSTEEATTSLKGVITSLLKPGKEAEKILGDLGVPFGATALRAEGLAGTLEKLAIVSEKYPDLLARAIPNIRGFTAAAALGTEQIAKIRETVKGMDEDQLSPAVAKQMETFNRATARAWGSIKLLAIEIGEQLAPAASAIMSGVISLVGWFRGLSKVTKQIITVILVLVGVFAPLVGGLAIFMTVAGPMFAVVGGILAALIGWPLAIAAIVAAMATFIALNWDKVTQAWGAIKGFFGFGDGPGDLKVTGAAEILSKTTSEIQIGVTGNNATIDSVRTKQTGRNAPNLGVNVAHAR